ncbi:hypothetical protein, partial [Pseudomonas viridiflava]|uniref:hypothetical protein n=1 Tax=Pseudomonas viridiflava TaxID=33069 RepID=UPI00197F21B8
MQRLQVTQNWSAVSGNCLMVRRDIFHSLDGLEAPTFTQGLQDLDLCMRVGRSGYLIVGSPDSTVVLDEPAAAVRSDALKKAPEHEQNALYQKWQ